MKHYHPIQIFTDGATRGNPGPGGYGVVIIDTNHQRVYEYGDTKNPTTNNEMELAAVVRALTLAQEKKYQSFTLFTDSKYVYSGITAWRHGWVKRGWKNKEGEPIKNLELWQQAHRLVSTAGFVDIQWIRVSGHMGVPGNERADTIATAFADNQSINLANGFIDTDTWDELAQVPSPEEIEKIRDRKRAHASGEGCWYISFVDGVVMDHQTWDECKERTTGVFAKYKKVCSEEEKDEVLAGWGIV
ncbi:ribonuclease HI [Candidatus Nomurabacteria bacterium]|nr:ribonuclease HI [Candidatus Nomurabacteria bacterium]